MPEIAINQNGAIQDIYNYCLGVMQKWCWRVLTIGSICLIYGIVERVNQLTNNVKFLIIIYHPDFRSYFYRRLLKLLALWFSYSFLLIKCTMQCKILKDMVDIDFKTSFPLNSRHFWDPPDNTKIYNPVPVYDLIAISKWRSVSYLPSYWQTENDKSFALSVLT